MFRYVLLKRIQPFPESKKAAYKSHVGEPSTFPKEKLDYYRSEAPSFEPKRGIQDKEVYYQAACQAIGIPYDREEGKVYHDIGHLEMSSSVDALDAVISIYRSNGHYVYSYYEYLDACKRKGNIERQIESIKKHQQQEDQRYQEFNHRYDDWTARDTDSPAPRYYEKPPPDMPSERDLEFLSVYDLQTFKLDEKGFLVYIQSVAWSLYSEIISTPLPLLLEEDSDNPHGYILGTTGSGKTELAKLFIHTYVTNHDYGSVILIDPHGDFAPQVARWKEFNVGNRLIYIDPTIGGVQSPVINPFEISNINASDYSDQARKKKGVIAQDLAGALAVISAEGAGHYSGNMITPLRNCIMVLLDRENSTLEDLARFMNNETNKDLIEFAKKLTHHKRIPNYFTEKSGEFNTVAKSTKDAIQRRIGDLLDTGPFLEMTCGKSTLFLDEEMQRKKVIIFNLSQQKMGADQSSAFGRLIIALTMDFMRQQGEKPKNQRIPCTLVIDECHEFISTTMSKIMSGARKYKLNMLLLQQTAGQHMPIELRDLVLGNAYTQIVGLTKRSGAKRNGEIIGVDSKDIMKMKKYEFYIQSNTSHSAVKFKTRSDLVDWRNCVTKFTWRRIVREQIEIYYQQTGEKVAIEEEPDISPQDW